MPISSKIIDNQILNGLSANPDNLETLQLVDIKNTIDSVYSVADSDQLPNVALNEGRLIYLEDTCSYRYSNGLEWTNCFASTCTVLGNLIYAAGYNVGGRLGTGDEICYSSPVQEASEATSWTQVSSGNASSYAVKSDGYGWGWGNGTYGHFGCNCCYSSPVQDGSGCTWSQVAGFGYGGLGITTGGELFAWGNLAFGIGGANCTGFTDNCTPGRREITSATDWCCVDGSYSHSVMMKTDNTLWGSGCNGDGELGINDTIQYSSPVQEITSATDWCYVAAGRRATTFAIKSNGTLWAWGRNLCGQLATNDAINYSSPVQEVTSATNWCVATGSDVSSAMIKTNGTLWTVGWNFCGSRGRYDINQCISSPVQEITSATDWCDVNMHLGYAVMALKTNGTLWGWGCNQLGSLGTNDTVCYSSPVQEASKAYDWCQITQSNTGFLGIRRRIRGFNEP